MPRTKTQPQPQEAPKRKVVRRVTTGLLRRMQLVPIGSLKPHPKNPRRGNVEAIKESLKTTGQVLPIVVQKSTMHILGGNHTWKAAVDLGWRSIAVVFLDVDDVKAERILLVLNRTNDLATYDTDALADILAGLDEPALGTGYGEDDVAAILEAIRADDLPAIQTSVRPAVEVVRGQPPVYDAIDDTDDGGNGIEEPEEPEGGPDFIKDVDDELPGSMQLKPEMDFERQGQWHIPPLRTDMLVLPEDIPEKLEAWAGTATRDNADPDQWWMWNYGTDSTSGMKQPLSQVILSFYSWDHYFEPWWESPDYFTTKALNSKITMAVMPNFSQWSNLPRAACLFNYYRSRWMARYFQEAGIKVIPDMEWPWGDMDYLKKIVLGTMPKKVPVLSFQQQTFNRDTTEADFDALAESFHLIVDTLSPELVLHYGGEQGRELWASCEIEVPVRYIQYRGQKLRDHTQKKVKEKTLS